MIIRWAEDDPNVIALIKTGSTARRDGREDEFSDLDLEVIAADPEKLLRNDGWFHSFGEVWVVLRFDERHYPTRLVVYSGGLKVDYTVADVGRLSREVAAAYGFKYPVELELDIQTYRATHAPVSAVDTD